MTLPRIHFAGLAAVTSTALLSFALLALVDNELYLRGNRYLYSITAR